MRSMHLFNKKDFSYFWGNDKNLYSDKVSQAFKENKKCHVKDWD